MTASPPITKIICVAVPSPLTRLFDYLAPPDSHPLPGMRVVVPFGKRTVQGVIVGLSDHSEITELKTVIEILDAEPLFTPKLMELFKWASDYYHYPLGMLFAAVIPSWLRNDRELNFTPAALQHNCIASDLILNAQQERAINQVTQAFNSFTAFLLDGVTGSGKTEVYMQLIAKTIAADKQALILVPEINLTPQTLQRFQQRFAVPIAMLHSQVPEKQRASNWLMAQQGTAPIVLGTRLAAFTPLRAPGIFIVDEEHDLSFKQQDRFRYSARDLLLKRAQLEQCPIVLGTATPSLETWHNVQTKRYQHLTLTTRAGAAEPPSVEIVDIRHKQLEAGISSYLLEQLKNQLQQGRQVLLFINRRGYAPVVMCLNCGWQQHCKQCDSNMIYHATDSKMRCHHCGVQRAIPVECPKCQSELKFVGLGTQRLEEFLAHTLPTAKIMRVDKDTVSTKNKMQKMFDQLHNGEANILIGTQMLAKGHHFPNIGLVAILDIDSALFSADFRAMERLGQLLIQVAGRSGRGSIQGKVILQTTQPEHPMLSTLLYSGYHAFLDIVHKERQHACLPPFSAQVLLRAETKTTAKAQNFLQKIKELIAQQASPVTCLGPIPAPMAKRQGYYRAQLLLQAPQRAQLQALLHKIIPAVTGNKINQQVRWTVDVDPQEMY